ncbi:hypothetical protein QQP08_008901 [Theobroma cacao]|nr:hypothetical protein QQP08_008901 [Theobroma cacao]
MTSSGRPHNKVLWSLGFCDCLSDMKTLTVGAAACAASTHRLSKLLFLLLPYENETAVYVEGRRLWGLHAALLLRDLCLDSRIS